MTLLSSAEHAFLFRFDWFHSVVSTGKSSEHIKLVVADLSWKACVCKGLCPLHEIIETYALQVCFTNQEFEVQICSKECYFP